MLIYIIKKLFSFLLLLGLLSILSVAVIYYSPDNVHNHESFIELYYSFFKKIFFDQFIVSSTAQFSLSDILKKILLPTFELCLFAIICAMIFGFPIGIASGLKNSHKFNHFIKLLCLLFYASPIVWLAILIISVTSVGDISWASIKNSHYSTSTFSPSMLDIFLSSKNDKWNVLMTQFNQLIIPVLILTIQPCIITIQLMSESVSQIANKNYIKVTKIRENSSLKILFQHLLPNAVPSVIPRLTYNTTTLLFSTMVVEIVLNRAGLGRWVFSAFYQHDYFIIALVMMSCGVLTCFLTLLSEIFVVLMYPIQSRVLYE